MGYAVGAFSESQEDYLETIYHLIEDRRIARVKDIADSRNVSMASVNSALKRLARDGLVEHVSRGIVLLTSDGEKLARKIIRRHEFIKDFLVSILRVSPGTAEKDACSFEHFMSRETFDRMILFFEFITTCSLNIQNLFDNFRSHALAPGRTNTCDPGHCFRHRHGRRIPVRSLTDLKPGESGVVGRIVASPLIRQRLIDMGVLPNVEVTVLRIAPLGDPLEIKLRGYNLSLRKEEAAAILLMDNSDDAALVRESSDK
jgi:DtxR family transcriptional regulator, Mn-dependent transcriptional regulator